MLLHIEKKLRVTYSSPVRDCVRHLRVLPHATQSETWRCRPEPDASREFTDDFGNRVLELRHTKIKREFLFELELEVAEPPSPLTKGVGGSAGVAQFALPETGLGAFVLPSALCDLGEAIRTATAPFQALPKCDLPAALCDWTFRALRYDATASGLETTASQSLSRGAGVCQDFAHLMIALCRACALPTRYVSGYAPGEGRMHAWVEVLINNTWQAFDPTHNRVIESAVPVAIGRDFRDCNPHQGTFRGRAKAKLESGCRVKTD